MYRIALAIALVSMVTCQARAQEPAEPAVTQTVAVGAEHVGGAHGPYVEYGVHQGGFGAFAGVSTLTRETAPEANSVFVDSVETHGFVGIEFDLFYDRFVRPLVRVYGRHAGRHGLHMAAEAGFAVGGENGGLRVLFGAFGPGGGNSTYTPDRRRLAVRAALFVAH